MANNNIYIKNGTREFKHVYSGSDTLRMGKP